MQQITNQTVQFKLRIVFIFLISFSATFAAVPTDWWPQNGQLTEWAVNTNNELVFTGNPGSAAMIATQFGDASTPPFTGFTLKFDAYIASTGANTSLVLGSNVLWGGTGIMLEINKFQIVGIKNFTYPGVQISSDVLVYQSKVILDNFNSFEVIVSGSGLISVKINDHTCPTNYQADVSILEAVAPAPKVALFATGFSGFKLRNVKISKNQVERQWFVPVVQLSGTYYIDSQNGSDLNSGQAENAAWRSFTNINRTTLAAGTKVLLKKGSTWNQRLEIRGTGTVNNWISVGAYGTDLAKPKISLTNNANDIGLLICDLDKTSGTARQQNISYIEVKDIEISNTRLGIFYRSVTSSSNIGFRVNNVTFNNINCDAVMSAINNASDKNAEITTQLSAVKGNLETLNGAADGGVREYIFPAAIFIGGQTASNQRVSIPANQRTVLTEFEVTNCVMNEAIAGVMSWFYWPFATGMGTDAWRQIVHKVKLQNITATGIVNGLISFDGVNGGCTTNGNGEPQADANGWGLIKNVAVTLGSSVAGRTWPNGTTGAILNNSQRFLVDSCEFSGILNQGNPDGCGFDFEANNDLVTIQNTKFLNNDGHSILFMNGGSFGGNTNTIIQKNLFAGNVKFGTSQFELYLNATSDNGGTHSNLKLRNNIAFMRKKNKNNQNISFYDTSNRSYITATANDLYYLEPTAGTITVSFNGAPYTYNAQTSSVTTPLVSALTLNNGATTTASRTILVNNACSLTNGIPAYYMVSESATFTGASWIIYNTSFNFQLSAGNSAKTVYFKVKNAAGESASFSSAITLNNITIAASSNNAVLGSVSGGNFYDAAAAVSLVATPTVGNHFVNWTENGSEVSTTATYTFSATVNRTLVANFEPDKVTLTSGSTNVSSISCSTCNVEVPNGGELIINANKTLKSVDLLAGGRLTLEAGVIFTATNGLQLRTTATETSTFVDKNVTSPQNFSGTARQYLTLGRNWYTANPITAGTASMLNRGTSVQTYSETAKGWTILNSTDALVVGKGYVSAALPTFGTSGNVIFTGTFNTGTITVPVTRTAGAKEGFNLVANPYPSYLDWSLVTADAANSAIGTTMWFRTTTSAAAYIYATYNSTGNVAVTNNAATAITKFIPPFQSFWIRVNSGTAATNFTLKNSMRAHRDVTPNTLKAPQQDSRPLIRLQVSNGVDIDETVIYFDENAENNLDSYDSPKMFNNEDSKPEIYTQISSDKLVINGLKSIANGLEIPIGFVAGAANSYSISSIDIKNTDAYKVVLVDKLRNKETELGTGVSYNFDADVTPAATSRFSLLFRTPGASTGTDNMLSENITVLVNAQNKIQINAPENSTYTIYNSIGVLLEQGLTKATLHTANINLQSGVYVVKVNSQTRKIIFKK